MYTYSSFKSWRLLAAGAAALCLGISQTKGDLFSMHGLDARAVGRMGGWAFFPLRGDLQQQNIADNAERTWPFDDVDDAFGPTAEALSLPNMSNRSGSLAESDVLKNPDMTDVNDTSDLSFSGWPSAQARSTKTIRLDHRNLTLTVWGNSPLSLTNLIIRHGTLTLQGTAGTAFIINIRNQFSLSHSAKIVLSGGLMPSDVVFNVLGNGNDVVIRGKSDLTGTLQAIYRTVRIAGNSVVSGDVIAREIRISRGSNVTDPPVVSP
jgi:Ice-binding-like